MKKIFIFCKKKIEYVSYLTRTVWIAFIIKVVVDGSLSTD